MLRGNPITLRPTFLTAVKVTAVTLKRTVVREEELCECCLQLINGSAFRQDAGVRPWIHSAEPHWPKFFVIIEKKLHIC